MCGFHIKLALAAVMYITITASHERLTHEEAMELCNTKGRGLVPYKYFDVARNSVSLQSTRLRGSAIYRLVNSTLEEGDSVWVSGYALPTMFVTFIGNKSFDDRNGTTGTRIQNNTISRCLSDWPNRFKESITYIGLTDNMCFCIHNESELPSLKTGHVFVFKIEFQMCKVTKKIGSLADAGRDDLDRCAMHNNDTDYFNTMEDTQWHAYTDRLTACRNENTSDVPDHPFHNILKHKTHWLNPSEIVMCLSIRKDNDSLTIQPTNCTEMLPYTCLPTDRGINVYLIVMLVGILIGPCFVTSVVVSIVSKRKKRRAINVIGEISETVEHELKMSDVNQEVQKREVNTSSIDQYQSIQGASHSLNQANFASSQGSSNAAFVPVNCLSNANYVKSDQSGNTEIGTLGKPNNATIDESGGSNYAAVVKPGGSNYAAVVKPDNSGNAPFGTSGDSGKQGDIPMFQAIRYDSGDSMNAYDHIRLNKVNSSYDTLTMINSRSQSRDAENYSQIDRTYDTLSNV